MIDLLQNFFDFLGPNERLGALVIDPNEIFNCCYQLRHAPKDASPYPLARDLTEPSLYKIQPRGTRRCKVQMESWMFLKPLFHIGVVVRPVVIQD